ncbi:DUF2637 domain-containing protein [Streptomyces sp. Iso 434]|uniref:DUF2637 domain-containing protein n=1 Tax=Streptomyces sp. Iso 434 TaxID=3062272 RepID=UPI00397FF903
MSPLSAGASSGGRGASEDASGRWGVVVGCLIAAGMIVVAAVGFWASFHTLRDAAAAHGFRGALSYAVPIGVDGAIIAFLSMDVWMTVKRRPWPMMRWAAHAMTLATVVLNASAARPSPGAGAGVDGQVDAVDRWVTGLWHGLMPLLFVVGVEGARHLLMHSLRVADGSAVDRIPLHRWVLDPRATGRFYRRMRLAAVTSYQEMVRREKDLRGYEMWLSQKYGGDLTQASEEERLPMTMAPRGLTVDEALALPGRWAAEAAQREEKRQRVEAEEQAAAEERELRAQAESERRRAELEIARARTAAEVRTARAEAEAAAGTAEVSAGAQTERARLEAEQVARQAEQARTRAEREAADEADAVETARAAALRRKAEEDDLAAARTERERLAERHAVEAERHAVEAERRRRAAEERQAAEDAAAAEEASTQALRLQAERAELARRVAVAEAEAEAAADVARVTPRERRARQVARMIHRAGGDVEAVSLADIEAATGLKRATAGELRQEAADLLAGGYDPTTDYVPAHQR